MCISSITRIKYMVKTMNEQLFNVEPIFSYPEIALIVLCVFGLIVYGAAIRQEKKSNYWIDGKK